MLGKPLWWQLSIWDREWELAGERGEEGKGCGQAGKPLRDWAGHTLGCLGRSLDQ